MRFLLLIGADEPETEEDPPAEFGTWLDGLRERGVLEVHEGLHPSATATTVQVRDDATLLTDGPFAEGREQIGGLAVIDCADLDEAVTIAATHPAARHGRIEIRPLR